MPACYLRMLTIDYELAIRKESVRKSVYVKGVLGPEICLRYILQCVINLSTPIDRA